MAKEFKDWDKRFSKAELDAERASWGALAMLDCWLADVWSWTHSEVRHAVYAADDSVGWQRFRVALKGLSTREKLGALLWRLQRAIASEDDKFRTLEYVRIDNYIGALRRGGQLDSNMRVVK